MGATKNEHDCHSLPYCSSHWGESLPLGVYVSWSMHYFFDINPYVWFACHWLVWFLLDLIQFKGIQVRNRRPPVNNTYVKKIFLFKILFGEVFGEQYYLSLLVV